MEEDRRRGNGEIFQDWKEGEETERKKPCTNEAL